MKRQKFSYFITIIFLLVFSSSSQVQSQNCPELVIQSITKSPNIITTTDNITFTIKIKNIGLAAAPQSVLGIKILGEAQPSTHPVPALASGATHTITRSKKLTTAKNYRVTAYADYNNQVNECMENNNTKFLDFSVIQGCSDLVIMKISKSPALAITTKKITFHVKVKNIGLAAAPSSVLGLKVQGETRTSSHRVPALSSGATTTINANRQLSVAKNYQITAQVDYSQKISECMETNNTKTFNFSVTQGCSDLVILKITKSPALPTTTNNIVFQVKVKNIGLATAPQSELGIKFGGERNPKLYKVRSLSSGASTSITRSKQFNVAKNYRITASADHTKKISECMENNNTKFLDFKVIQGCSDLIVKSITRSPANPTTRDKIVFKVVVKNIGLANAPASVLGIKIGGGATSNHRVRALSRSATATITLTKKLGVARKYRITAYADHTKKISECIEYNNTRFLKFTVSK